MRNAHQLLNKRDQRKEILLYREMEGVLALEIDGNFYVN